ncbi:hypothetical protein K1719_047272 [Acacia pycnantha]|nr:hypothetical protein K1719_047272 [Acacia pycnantha]
MKLWSCNFNSQLANALKIEGDYLGSISALECGFACAREIGYPELQMFFATSILHVHLRQWDDDKLVEQAVNKCNEIWDSIESNKRQQCIGLLFYNELLHIFYRLRLCDYKNSAPHVDKLDAAMKAICTQTQAYARDDEGTECLKSKSLPVWSSLLGKGFLCLKNKH